METNDGNYFVLINTYLTVRIICTTTINMDVFFAFHMKHNTTMSPVLELIVNVYESNIYSEESYTNMNNYNAFNVCNA